MNWIRQVLGPLPPRLRRWVFVVLALGLLVVGVSLALATSVPAVSVVTAAGFVAAAKTIHLRIRIGSEGTSFTWGETALVIALALLSPPWIAPAVLAGVLISQLLTRAPVLKAAYNSASHATAAAAAAGVVVLGGGGPITQLNPHTITVLCLAVVTATGFATVFAAGAVSAASGSRFATVVTRGIGITILMMLGNVALGLLVVSLGIADMRWLFAVPPLLWLLNEAYNSRLRAGEERRAWQELADATHQLNHLDKCRVVKAAVHSACRLFSPDAVEVVTENPRRVLVGTPGGELVESGAALEPGAEHVITRPLAVGELRIGELRLRFQQKVSLSDREQLALSAFADALGAAMHNASAHATLRDMANRKSYEAAHDPLTGLANRSRLLEYGESALRSLADSGRGAHMALLLLDLNHFKDVNDALGHAAGDQLLQAIATRLADAIEPDEMLARLGGDEFGLMITSLPETASPIEHAASRGRQLLNAITAPADVAGVALSMEASVGVVAAPAGSCDMTELLRRADVAMYQAKRSGRTIAAYDAGKDGASTDRLALVAELREALGVDDQLVLELQPAVDLVTGGPVGAEALIRWRHPRRGLLAPGEFVSVVEQSELVGPFTRYVIDKALALAASWAEEGLDVPIAVNLSARSLLDRRLPTDVAELLGKHRVPPERLVLEITETVMMTELDVIEDVLGALRELGAQLAVDDFGTGYSSLTFLARFPVHEVKVDQAFVTRMIDSPEARAIVRTTVELGRALGLRVVAEGVETGEQRAALAEMGCTAAQGYHFFPPMPAEKASNVLWTLHRSAEARGGQVIRFARGANE
ncbi:MAG: EAL domain-containing protein [Micromonosporaceae bacterium]|nr:EAL domain-containing protein [Micromonosporaceae bacterium]